MVSASIKTSVYCCFAVGRNLARSLFLFSLYPFGLFTVWTMVALHGHIVVCRYSSQLPFFCHAVQVFCRTWQTGTTWRSFFFFCCSWVGCVTRGTALSRLFSTFAGNHLRKYSKEGYNINKGNWSWARCRAQQKRKYTKEKSNFIFNTCQRCRYRRDLHGRHLLIWRVKWQLSRKRVSCLYNDNARTIKVLYLFLLEREYTV